MATLNEFREFFGMSRHTSFADVNSDKDIQDALCKMYQHPDLIELYPGLFCEGQGRCLDPGTNCPNGTGTALWRGVFSDAVTLVRSDRFYTLDWNVDTLTSWGMNEVIPDPYTFKGGVMARLFHRAFPGYFKPDSIHMWQPFYTPAMNLILAHQQGLLQELEPGKDCERLGVDGATLGITAKQFKNVMSDEHRQGILGPKAIERYRRAPRASKQPQTNGNVPHQGTSTQRVLSATAEPSRYNPKADVLDLSDSDMRDLLSHQQKLNNAYCALSWYKQLTSNRAADEEALLNKLRFKLLKDRVKMGVPTRPQAPSPISDFDLIKRILEKKDDFKNPGFADETAIPAGPLRSVLSGGELLDEALKIVQKTIGNRTDAEQMFTDYFTTMARYMEEKWRFDMQEYSDKAGTTHQVRQIDIIDG